MVVSWILHPISKRICQSISWMDKV